MEKSFQGLETIGRANDTGRAHSHGAISPTIAEAERSAEKRFNRKHPEVSEAEEERRRKMPATTGEWGYFWIQFWFVKGLILAATGVIGYQAKFGKDSNVIRKFQKWCMEKIAAPAANAGEHLGAKVEKSIGGSAGKWIGGKTHEVMALFGGAFASTMVLFHGGNLVAPVVQWFENHRKDIITDINHRWGKPGEEEKGNEKFQDMPHQDAGDVVKGRLTAWVTVFASFFTAFLLFGKMKGTNTYRLDAFEDLCARTVSGLGKKSKFGHIPIHEDLAEVAKAKPEMFADHKRNLFWYKATRILALDFYATTASIIVWNFASRLSARSRSHGESFFEALNNTLFKKKHAQVPTPQKLPEDASEVKKEDAPTDKQDASIVEAPAAKKEEPSVEKNMLAEDKKPHPLPGHVVKGAVLQAQDRVAAPLAAAQV